MRIFFAAPLHEEWLLVGSHARFTPTQPLGSGLDGALRTEEVGVFMFTRESLSADIQALKQQLAQGEYRVYSLQQELQRQIQVNERLLLTIGVSEKFLAQFDVPAQDAAPHGLTTALLES